MKSIDGRAKLGWELLDGARYTIDLYQREDAWGDRQARELVDDLTGKFLDFCEEDDDRSKVETYGHYFLDSVVISSGNQQRFIVDGQQHFTPLTLVMIYLLHIQLGWPDAEPIAPLVFIKRICTKKFNLDVKDRATCVETVGIVREDALALVEVEKGQAMSARQESTPVIDA